MPQLITPLAVLLSATVAFAPAVYAQQATQDSDEAAETQLDMQVIERAFAAKDFVTVRSGLEQLGAQSDDALVQYRLGRVLVQGLGGPADRVGAIAALEKAVAQNHVPATILLARILLAGGEFYDAERAAALLASAAPRGSAEAQYRLGLLLSAGQGVAQDHVAAFNWFLAAAEEGFADAQFELSKAYSRGQGVDEDVTKALEWLDRAANNGHVRAQYFLANAYDSGPEAFRDLGQALQWYRRAAEAGLPLAQRSLGTKYLTGEGDLAPNAQEAERWLTAAAESGDPGAAQNLALGYLQGTVLPQNDERAAYWFERASSDGLGRSSLAYGQMLQAGRGVEQNFAEAVKYYQKAVTEGERAAALILGNMAIAGEIDGQMAPHTAVPLVTLVLEEEGRPEAQDWLQKQADAGLRPAQLRLGLWYLTQEEGAAKAAPLLEAAATAGEVEAQFQLGTLYTTGSGVPLDYVIAHKWLNIAAASGHQEAAETRGVVSDLMTPEQIADAQAQARTFFDTAGDRAPQTDQIVRGNDGQVISGGTE